MRAIWLTWKVGSPTNQLSPSKKGRAWSKQDTCEIHRFKLTEAWYANLGLKPSFSSRQYHHVQDMLTALILSYLTSRGKWHTKKHKNFFPEFEVTDQSSGVGKEGMWVYVIQNGKQVGIKYEETSEVKQTARTDGQCEQRPGKSLWMNKNEALLIKSIVTETDAICGLSTKLGTAEEDSLSALENISTESLKTKKQRE